MEILCRCTSCSAPFKVDAKYAGRKARCPKCSTVVVVPLAEDTAGTSPAPPVTPAPPATKSNGGKTRFVESPASAESVTAADFPELQPSAGSSSVLINPNPTATPSAGSSAKLGRLTGAPRPRTVPPPTGALGTPPPVATSRAKEPPAPTTPTPSAEPELTFAPRPPRTAEPRRKGGGKPPRAVLYWVIGGGALALTLAVGVIIGVAAYLSGRPTQVTSRSGPPVLVLEWNDDERRDAALSIDGKKQPIKPGPMEFTLSEGPHTLTLRRRGFEQIDYAFSLRKGDRFPFRPDWKAAPFVTPPIAGSDNTNPGTKPGGSPSGEFSSGPLNFPGWLQSLEVARRHALEKKKDIFLVFAGSDWSPQSIKMATDIFSQPRFKQFAEPRFELVVIDLPRTEAGLNQLEDVNQNREQFRKFGVRSVPTIALLDAAGTPYVFDGVFTESIEKYIPHVTLLQAKHNTRDAKLLAVEAAKQKSPDEQLAAATQAVSWLESEKLLPHYGGFLGQCLKLARQLDPNNEAGKFEVLLEADWLVRLNRALLDQDQGLAVALLKELRRWSEEHKFSDPNRAVKLHLTAAVVLINALSLPDEAHAHLQIAQTYTPSEPELKRELESLAKALRSRDQLSSGTGFVIDTRGYLLTNHHVVEGPGKTVVRIPGSNKSVPAEIIAQDTDQDIALLRVDPAAFTSLPPLPVTTAKVNRASSVAVFGFPLGDDIGNDVRITTGVVSALPEQSEDGMLLLDCRVNPGNSGGPVLSRAGQVIGMVTAKTSAGAGLDSYGMALPSQKLQDFLVKNLPGYVPPSPGGAAENRDWEQIDREVSGSIFMVLKVK